MNDKHFVLTDETIVHDGVTLHRIKATRDIQNGGVLKGDLGGFVESERNISDRAWVYDDAMVFGRAHIYGDARIINNARVFGNARVERHSLVSDDAQVFDNAYIFEGSAQGNARVYGDATLAGWSSAHDNAQVLGNVRIQHGAKVGHNAQVSKQVGIISGSLHTSVTYTWTFYTTADGGVIGNIRGWDRTYYDWYGTPDDLAALAASGEMIIPTDGDFEAARPEMAALASFWKASAVRMLTSPAPATAFYY